MWDFDDPRKSELRFRRLAREAKGPAGADLQAGAMTQIARAQGLQRRFRAAHRTLDRIVPTLPDRAPQISILYSLERGRVFRSGGQPQKALPYFLAAWRVARRNSEDGLAVDAAHMIALVKSGAGQGSWNAKALRLADGSRDSAARSWRASLLNNIGWSEFESGNYRGALHSFQRALRYRQRESNATETRIAKWCVAKTLRLLGRTRIALRRQRNLLNEWRRARGKDGYVFEEIAECLLTIGKPAEARKFFRQAHRVLSADPWLAAQEPTRLNRLLELSGGSHGNESS
jgi:tetratricopeptide (TPR) repeat protein